MLWVVPGYFSLQAQEHFSGLPYNPVLKQHAERPGFKSFKAASDTLELPFIDDFSSTAPYPDFTRWLNNYVYINNQYAANPMSVGVATFDVYDQEGNIYPSGNLLGNVIPADTLTSSPIDLDINLTTGNSIYLTFYFQIGGNAPGVSAHPQDSLVVEFYKPSSRKWYNAISLSPETVTDTFEQITLEVVDSLHEKGFQFRLRNYVSKDNHEDGFYRYAPWHIDYVILDEGLEEDPRPTQDVAFTGEGDFIFEDGHKSIPWPHFAAAQSQILKNTATVHFSNFNYPNNGFAHAPSFMVREAFSGYQETGGIFDETITMTEEKDSLTFTSEYILGPNSNDSALLSIHYQIEDVPLNLDIESNNEFVIEYPCYNYYAYDDGSAEGVLLLEHNSIWASRFESFKQDTLRAIDFYFLPSYGSNEITQNFIIMIWAEGDNGPGELLLEKGGNEVRFEDRRNGFVRYYLEPLDTLLVGETFYIGIKNITFQETRIGLGVDANSHKENTYYRNDNNQWVHDTDNIPYAPMIRPVMGKKVEIPVSVPQVSKDDELSITIYPNPASDLVHIKGPDNRQNNYQIEVYNTTGQQIDRFRDKKSYNVSHLNEGFYIMVIRDPNSGRKTSQKLIISR